MPIRDVNKPAVKQNQVAKSKVIARQKLLCNDLPGSRTEATRLPKSKKLENHHDLFVMNDTG
ncbi:hypothetical protein Spb1_03760 [Planctopirus ephydatiae]|uniref:Uncharacterized protein n=1 Tax=Planctopirus ephydatiae TaxID=2528019 RepID=A0A518GIV0_9PLAN|nr:hypothetical protein Spb1_03760 [Planctopirus ephydatiae]